MRNIHILPTDKPSRLFKYNNELGLSKGFQNGSNTILNQNIYITNNEEIKDGDYGLGKNGSIYKFDKTTTLHCIKMFDCKKIILTTDVDLIKDGVQAIGDEFLEWFVKNPSCESVDVDNYIHSTKNGHIMLYNIIIPKEEPKQETENLKNFKKLVSDETSGFMKDFIKEKQQETIEEIYLNGLIDDANKEFTLDRKLAKEVAIKFAKWQQQQNKNLYSEEEVLEILRKSHSIEKTSKADSLIIKWFEQFKKK